MNPVLLQLLTTVVESLVKAAATQPPVITLPPQLPNPSLQFPAQPVPPVVVVPTPAPAPAPANVDVLPDSLKAEATGHPAAEPLTVDVLQRFLNLAGANPPLNVDGLYGPKTEAALQQAAALIARLRGSLGG